MAEAEPATAPEQSLTRHFSFAEITWKINNISIAASCESYSIDSDEFMMTGTTDTVWRLCLTTSKERDRVRICLRMLQPVDQLFCAPGGRVTGLKVYCKAFILDSTGEEPLKSERKYYLNARDTALLETYDFDKIMRNLSHSGPDCLKVKCYMLVDYQEVIYVPGGDVPHALVDLSNTLVRLPTEALFPDLWLHVGKRTFFLHKDMFYNVKAMPGFFDKQNSDELTLLNYDEYATETIFRYAYSGNLGYILPTPRISLYEYIVRFDVPELQGVYPKVNIPLVSTLKTEVFTTEWKIPNLESVDEPLNGPSPLISRPIRGEEMNSRFQIRMYPKGKSDANVQENKYVHFEVSLLESNKPVKVVVEFACLVEDKPFYSRRNQKQMEVGDCVEVPLLLRGGALMRRCLVNNDLFLRITMWCTSEKDIINEVGIVNDPPSMRLTNEVTLNILSRKMDHILANAEKGNPDITVKSGQEEFPAHKFVLASRSPYLKDRLPSKEKAIYELYYEKHFVRVLLEYMYTGLFTCMEFKTTWHLFEFGFRFKINHLLTHCGPQLTPANVLQVLECADDYKLEKVKIEAVKLIFQIGNAITGHNYWFNFFQKKELLALYILNKFKQINS